MNNTELERLIKKDKQLSQVFIGIYANNTLPKQIPFYPCALIVNTQPSYMPGEHWVAMYFGICSDVDYFDSFGIIPFIPSFNKFICNNSIYQNYNQRRLQSSDSAVCGVYCLYFLYFRCRNVNMCTILNVFDWFNFKYNDHIVCEFLTYVFGYSHKVCCRIK